MHRTGGLGVVLSYAFRRISAICVVCMTKSTAAVALLWSNIMTPTGNIRGENIGTIHFYQYVPFIGQFTYRLINV